MTIDTNLKLRGRTYYLRIARPTALQNLRARLGLPRRSDVWKSLKTSDLSTARIVAAERKAAALDGFARESDELSGKALGRPEPRVPSEFELRQGMLAFKKRELQIERLNRLHAPTPAEVEKAAQGLREAVDELKAMPGVAALADPRFLDFLTVRDAAKGDHENRRILKDELKRHRSIREFVLVDWAVWEMARANNWLIEPKSIHYRQLADGLLAAWINALDAMEKRDLDGVDPDGDEIVALRPLSLVVGSKTLVASHPSEPSRGARPTKGERLQDHFDRYLRERKDGVVGATRKELRSVVRRFVEFAGDRVATDYTLQEVSKFKLLLQKVPRNATTLYPGKSYREIVELNQSDGHRTLATPSVNNKLSILARFGKWLSHNVDGVDGRAFATTSILTKRAPSNRSSFSDEQMIAILNALTFTGCESERNQLAPGSFKVRDYRYWLTLIAAYTGARLNEIAQLRVDDICELDGIWTISIKADGDGQSTKTSGSARVIPMHPILIELGLPSLAASVRTQGGGALFPEIPIDADGRRAKQAGQWFRRFLARIGVRGGEQGGVHRLRHTVTDKMRVAGVEEYDIAPILGHSVDVARMTGKYGRHQNLSLAHRFEIISKVTYPGVDVGALG